MDFEDESGPGYDQACFGIFKCRNTKCKRTWGSNNAWAHFGQICAKCKTLSEVVPSSLSALYLYKCPNQCCELVWKHKFLEDGHSCRKCGSVAKGIVYEDHFKYILPKINAPSIYEDFVEEDDEMRERSHPRELCEMCKLMGDSCTKYANNFRPDQLKKSTSYKVQDLMKEFQESSANACNSMDQSLELIEFMLNKFRDLYISGHAGVPILVKTEEFPVLSLDCQLGPSSNIQMPSKGNEVKSNLAEKIWRRLFSNSMRWPTFKKSKDDPETIEQRNSAQSSSLLSSRYAPFEFHLFMFVVWLLSFYAPDPFSLIFIFGAAIRCGLTAKRIFF